MCRDSTAEVDWDDDTGSANGISAHSDNFFPRMHSSPSATATALKIVAVAKTASWFCALSSCRRGLKYTVLADSPASWVAIK